MRNLLLILSLIIVCTVNSSSQLEYSNWYFGDYAGVTFNTPSIEPIFLTGNPIKQFEGVATISDGLGNLLLFTNGEFVFNRFGEVLNLGNPLYGHQSSTQSAIIFPHPGKPGFYFIFTADAGEYTGNTNRGVNYSIIDINANSGKGDFVEFNIPLLSTASEQLSATYHANGKDMWVVARGWKNNNFYAYHVTEAGIKDTVITPIGYTRTKEYNSIGCLKFSPFGSMAVMPVYEEDFFELFRFDKQSGEFYNYIQIKIADHYTLYGAEFSANGKVLYISSSKNPFGFYSIYQYDVSDYNKIAIENSKFQLVQEQGHIGTLQRGLNNKIYIAPMSVPSLYSIENPNILGGNARFITYRVRLQDSLSQLGLPQTFFPPPKFKSFSVCEGNDVILDTDVFLDDTNRYESSYFWTGPNGFMSLSPKPVIKDITVADSGLYVLTLNYKFDDTTLTNTYSIYIRVGKHFKFNIIGNDTICEGKFTTLTSDTINNKFTYLWSNNNRTPSIIVNQQGLYKLFITNEFGCVDSAEFYLTVIKLPNAGIIGSQLICHNKPVTLSSVETSPDNDYLWSTGDTTTEITVDSPGIYTLIVTNQNNCKDTAGIKVVSIPDLKVKIIGDTIWCKEGSVTLEAEVKPYDPKFTYTYLWSTGENTPVIKINKSDTYYVTVTIENICSFEDSITVRKADPPKLVVDIPQDIKICEGEIFIADLVERDSTLEYIWSDGSTDFPRIINSSGVYKIIVSNRVGCTIEYEFTVTILDKPVAEIIISDEINICNADSLTLEAYPKGDQFRYLWLNDGSTEERLVIKLSGIYYLVVNDVNGCTDTTSIRIELGTKLPFQITGRTSACYGDSLELTANIKTSGNQEQFSFLWSTGETGRSIIVKETGEYKVLVKHISGCEGTDSVLVRFMDVPKIKLNYSEPQTICMGDEIIVTPDTINTGWNYYWNDGSFELPRSFNKSGQYTLYAVNAGMCSDSAVFKLIVADNPIAKISLEGDSIICEDESVILRTDLFLPENTYLWSDGSQEQSLEVTNPGMYYLKVTNPIGCSTIDSILIQRAEVPQLILTSIKPYLCPNDSITIRATGNFSEITWQDGSIDDEFTVYNEGFVNAFARTKDGCLVQDSIYIQLFSEPITVIANNVDFGTLCPGGTITKNSIIQNLSDYDIEIIKIEEVGDDEIQLISKIVGDVHLAGSSKELSLKFSPLNHGNYFKKIKIIYKHICTDSLEFEVTGTSTFSSSISLPDVEAISGQELCFSVIYKLECASEVDFISDAIIKIKFDAQYFIPKSVNIGSIIRNEVKDGIRYLEIKLTDVNIKELSGNLVSICGTAMIGNDTLTPLILENFEWSEDIGVQMRNGSIRNQACALDIRNVTLFTPTTINITPNPVTDFIKVDVISQEKGIFVIEIIDYEGRTVMRDSWLRNKDDSDKKIINLPTTQLSSGLYMVKVSSPWNVYSSSLIILK